MSDDHDKETEVYEDEQFKNYDKNGDGKLDDAEMVDWVLPTNHEAASEEADHLIDIADLNKDEKLSEQEVVEHHEDFVGSQATNFGSFHDEL